jgi:hypothetical protein
MVDTVGVSGAPPLVGREPVLASLRTALGAAVKGHGTFVLLTGEAGIGKTALAAHLADEAARAGVPVAWGRCADGDGVPAYWPWTQVLRATGGLASDIDHLGDGAKPLDAGSALGAQDRFRLFDRVIGHLDLSARDHGIVVVLETSTGPTPTRWHCWTSAPANWPGGAYCSWVRTGTSRLVRACDAWRATPT